MSSYRSGARAAAIDAKWARTTARPAEQLACNAGSRVAIVLTECRCAATALPDPGCAGGARLSCVVCQKANADGECKNDGRAGSADGEADDAPDYHHGHAGRFRVAAAPLLVSHAPPLILGSAGPAAPARMSARGCDTAWPAGSLVRSSCESFACSIRRTIKSIGWPGSQP